MQRRENTFRIDYASIPKKPSYEELHHFVGTVLGLKREEVQRLQCSRYHGCAFVKTSSLSVAERVVRENDGKHELEVDKKTYKIRLWMEDGGVDVKLHDLSEDVNDEAIREYMLQYGDILSIRELTWDSKYTFGEISTGIRVVRMVVKKNIPSIVTIDAETTCVSYSGQLHTCRYCNELAHNGVTCIQNKKLLLQKLHAEKVSYANVAKQTNPAKTTAKKPSNNAPRRDAHTAGIHIHKRSSSASSATSTSNQNSSAQQQRESMPPPAFLVPPTLPHRSETDFPPLTKSASQPAPSDYSQQRSDAHDSDCSTSSNNSRRLRIRPPGKKMRHDNETNPNTEV